MVLGTYDGTHELPVEQQTKRLLGTIEVKFSLFLIRTILRCLPGSSVPSSITSVLNLYLLDWRPRCLYLPDGV